MKGLIVLEGADSSGKTTLANRIKERFPGTIYMHGLPWVGWVEEAHVAMMAAALKHVAAGKLVVIDRHWVSEYVYGPTFRGGVAYPDLRAKRFDEGVRDLGLYVLCVPSDAAEHERRFQRERPEKKDLFDSMTRIAETYRRLATGYMHHEGDDYLSKYIRHGDFAICDTVIYDLDADGGRMDDVIGRIKSKLSFAIRDEEKAL